MTGISNGNSLKLFYTILFLLSAFAVWECECQACGTGCAVCSSPTRCTTCTNADSEGPLNDGSGGCGSCGVDCFSCSVNGAFRCDTCDPGYRLNFDNTCRACTVADCTKCPSDSGTCTECKSGKVLSGNTCQSCDIHCDFCNINGAGKCDPDYCQAGYTFDNATKTCIVCGTILHCLDCHVDPNVCIMCDEALGYGVTNTGKCDACNTRTGCFRCHNLTQCTECSNAATTEPAMDGSGTCIAKSATTVSPPANATQAASTPPAVTGTAPPPVTAGPTGTAPPPVTAGPTGTAGPMTAGPTGTAGPMTAGPTGTAGPMTAGPTGTAGPITDGPMTAPGTGSVPGPVTGQTGGDVTTAVGPQPQTTGPLGPATTGPPVGPSGASSAAPSASPASPGVSSTGPASGASTPGQTSTPAPPASTVAPGNTTTGGGGGSSGSSKLWFLFIPGGVLALCLLLCCCWYCCRGVEPGIGFMPFRGVVRTRVAAPIIRTRVVRAAPYVVERDRQFRVAPMAYYRGGIFGGDPIFGNGF